MTKRLTIREIADRLEMEVIFRYDYVPKIGDYVEELNSTITEVVNIHETSFYIAKIKGENVLISTSLRPFWGYHTYITRWWEMRYTRFFRLLDSRKNYPFQNYAGNRIFFSNDVILYRIEDNIANEVRELGTPLDLDVVGKIFDGLYMVRCFYSACNQYKTIEIWILC